MAILQRTNNLLNMTETIYIVNPQIQHSMALFKAQFKLMTYTREFDVIILSKKKTILLKGRSF